MDLIQTQPFLVAILAGAGAQFIKVISFLIVEKRVNYRRFVQADGAPNMHSATFSGLAVAVGLTSGFDSLAFALAVCVTAIIMVDTLNVKNATSRHAEAILLVMDRLRKKKPAAQENNSRQSYTPMDVFTGMALGIFVALLLV